MQNEIEKFSEAIKYYIEFVCFRKKGKYILGHISKQDMSVLRAAMITGQQLTD